MSRPPLRLILSCLLAAACAPVAAQQGDDPDIVVTGKPIILPSQKEQEAIASRYVRELTVIENFEALALYEPKVYCPAVLGLSDEVNGLIKARMRGVAAAAGIDPAEDGCRTSALVIFVDDKDAFITAFRREHPVYFISLKDRRWRLPDEPGPAIAWQLAQKIDDNGMPVGADENGIRIVSQAPGGSRLRAMTYTAIAMSIVLIERAAVRGFTTDQVADYAVMRTLTTANPNKLADSGAPTILTLLATPMGEEAFASLTAWDMAYLRSRYDSDPKAYAVRSASRIRHEVREAIKEQPAQSPGSAQ